MNYFSYNDYIDYTENGEINEIGRVEEDIAEYKIKNVEEIKDSSKNKIISMLRNKTFLKKFMEEFFNLSEIGDIKDIFYYNCKKNLLDKKGYNIICKIEKKEIFILIKVIDKIDSNITYKMFENSINLMRMWNRREKRENKRYPIIIPIVIYLGKTKWNIKCNNIFDKINYTQCKENMINFSYNIIDINTLEIHNLSRMDSSIAKELINAKINIYK